MLTARHEVGSDASKRNRQIIEALSPRVRQRNAVENEFNLLPGIKSGRELQSIVQAKLQRARVLASILLPAERQVPISGLTVDDLVPLDALHDVAQFSSISPGGVHAAYESTHAGTSDISYRDAVLFQVLDNPDMRQPQRTPSLQDQSELGLFF